MEVPGKPGSVGGTTMDVPGRRNDDRRFCTPCENGGRHITAIGFCTDCFEFLCQSCFDHHRNARLGKGHKLLTKTEMPFSQIPSHFSDVACTVTCERHINEFIKLYCQDHDIVVCTICSRMNHPNCKLTFIPDVARGFKDSDNYKNILETVNIIAGQSEEVAAEIARNLQQIRTITDDALEHIKQFRIDINEYLDKRETELMTRVREIEKRDNLLMKNLEEGCQRIQKDIEQIRTQLENPKNSVTKLFVVAKHASPQIAQLKTDVDSLNTRNVINRFIFEIHPEMQRIITSQRSIGNLVFAGEKQTREQDAVSEGAINNKTIFLDDEIYVKSKSDQTEPCITGMSVLSEDTLVLADLNNKAVKIIDTIEKKIKSKFTLPCQPWDIAKLPNKHIAVTTPGNKQVEILSTEGGSLARVSTFPVNGRCLGICCSEDSMIVSYNDPPKVEILDIDGNVLKTIEYDQKGNKYFNNPAYITVAVMRGSNSIIVSDSNNKCVFQMTMDGAVSSKYTCDGQFHPSGVAYLGKGEVAICNRDTKSIQVLSDDGWNLTEVCQWKCARKPQFIAVRPDLNYVYLSSSGGWLGNLNYIRVYKRL